MSTLETNSIGTYSNNNVSIDDALNLKSYDTTGRDALTSVAGDVIYNSTDSKPQFYNGTEWKSFETPKFSISYLIIAGGGSGGTRYAGGGGAGGYRNSYASETSGRNGATETPLTIFKDGSTEYRVTVGAGGAANGAIKGNDSVFNIITSLGGGSGNDNKDGGCGAGGSANTIGPTAGSGTTGQGFDGGSGSATNNATAGGGGTGGNGTASSGNYAGNGGTGLSSSITGTATTRGGGGGGGGTNYPAGNGTGGTGGGGDGRAAGTANTGGGGGASYQSLGSAGGSGIVILRWATADATIGSTRTGLTDGGVQTDGDDSYIVFTAGTGTITFS